MSQGQGTEKNMDATMLLPATARVIERKFGL